MSNLYSSYERLAKVYAKKAGINLIIRGGGFSTDGKKIVIAEIPDELNKALRDPALAGLVHECNHIKHSWFPRNKKEAIEKSLDKFQIQYKGLINNLEDVRILHLGRKEYPGMDSLQNSGLKFIRKSFLEQEIKDKKIPISSLLGMCIQWKESNIDSSFFPNTVNQMAELTKDIWQNANWTPYEKGHDEAENMVKRIIKRLKQQQQQEEETPEKKEIEEKSKGQDKGNKRKTKNKNKKEKGEKTNEDEKEEEEENSKQKLRKKMDKLKETKQEDIDTEENHKYEAEQTTEESNPQPPEESSKTNYNGDDLEEDLERLFDEETQKTSTIDSGGLMEVMAEVIEAAIQKHNTNLQKHIPHPGIIIHDREEHIKNPFKNKYINSAELRDHKENLRDSLQKIDKQTEKLKAKALPLLMAEKRDSFIYEQKEGIIDGAQLYKLQKGNGNIYKQKVLGKKINTAVSILCDVSGSMTGRKIQMLRSTLLVIGDTMFALKIPFEILSFTTDSYRHKDIQKIRQEYYENPKISPYNRFEPLLLTIIKDFNENYSNIRNLIPMMDPSRNTPTNEAFKWGCKRLIQRKENRKLLLTIEDGWPSLDNSNKNLLEKDLIENIAKAEKDGIEIIGIGLLSSSVENLYKNSIVINEIDQISIRVYEALLKTLKIHNQNRR